MKKIVLILIIFLISTSKQVFSQANNVLENQKTNPFHKNQTNPDLMSDIYNKSHFKGKAYVPLASLREADVMWSKKIWREIDMRQKVNHPLYYPQETEFDQTVDRDNLFKLLYDAATGNGEISINVYDDAALDDEFKTRMTATELIRMIKGEIAITYWKDFYGEDSINPVTGQKVIKNDTEREGGIDLKDIKKWRIKEQWFLDKQRSVMDVRIIGICPIADGRDEITGELSGADVPLCWFYFPEIRDVLKNALCFNMYGNEAENRTFEDIFMKRMFSSTIVKEGNVYDREINEYMIGLDALLEAERIKNEIFEFEHDLWEY